jgi:hypothetical protein
MYRKRAGKDLCFFFFATPSSPFDESDEYSPCWLDTGMVASMKSVDETIKGRFRSDYYDSNAPAWFFVMEDAS